MGRGHQKRYLEAARNNFSQSQVVIQRPRVQDTFECSQCTKEKGRDCFSKTTLKRKDGPICRDCQDYFQTATNKGFFNETGWVDTAPKVNEEAAQWDFEEGRKLYPSTPHKDVCVNNPFPRPAKLTKYPDIGVVAALLTAATITQTPTGKLKFKSLGLDIPSPKNDSEWGTWDDTAAPVVTPRPHHKPILTEAMKKENGGGGWGRGQRKTNIVVPQFARGGVGMPDAWEPAAGW